jgi:hypothetical protein
LALSSLGESATIEDGRLIKVTRDDVSGDVIDLRGDYRVIDGNFEGMGITSIAPGAFSEGDFSDVTALLLSGNKIETIEANAFQGLSSLTW